MPDWEGLERITKDLGSSFLDLCYFSLRVWIGIELQNCERKSSKHIREDIQWKDKKNMI